MAQPTNDAQRTKLLQAPIPPLVTRLSIPTIAGMLVTSIYNMADTFFVSQISTSASGAVGIVFAIMSLIQAVGFTVGVGASSIASRLLGQGDQEEANRYASSAVLAALAAGLLLTILGLSSLPRLMWWLGSTQTIYPYARQYAFFILLSAPVMTLSFTLNNLLRWQGLAKLAVVGLTIGGGINILLDPILIFGFKLGIVGAGAATLISMLISMTILLSFFLLHKSTIRLGLRYISRTPRLYLHIFKQGLPSFFRQSVMGFSTMSLNFNARIYGDAAVAALAIVQKVFMVIHSITIGFGQGFQPVIGYNYGAGKPERVKEAVMFSEKVITLVLTIAAAAGFLFAPQIVSLFRDDPDVINIGVRAFRFQCFTLPLSATLTFSNMLFQALGKVGRATVLAVCRQGLYIPMVFFLSRQFGLTGLEASQTGADLLAFLLSASLLFHYFKYEFGTDGPKQPK